MLLIGGAAVKLVYLLVLITALGGCAATWTKPGATAAEFDGTKASCLARARARFQPNIQHVAISNGYTTPTQTQCSGIGYMVSCTSTGGQYIPPAFMDIDTNNAPRDQDLRACFFEAGWTPNK